MDSWMNIDIASDDIEKIKIDQLQSSLGELPEPVIRVRELITRFEVCHFKYQRHYYIILDSIRSLKPVIEIDKIGLSHPRHKDTNWKYEPSGRSRDAKMHIQALYKWIGLVENSQEETFGLEFIELKEKINSWLGRKNEKKDKLVHMLISRLMWESVEPYRSGGELYELEYQIEATDICNYAFPENIHNVIKAIGKMEPAKEFDGCGTCNVEIYSFLNIEFKKLCNWLNDDTSGVEKFLGIKEPIKIWLVLCLAKTIKTDLHIKDPIAKL